MRGIRTAIVTTLLALLVVLPVTLAGAQDQQDIGDFESGVVRDFDGALEEFCPDYPVGDCLLLLVEVVGPACEVPVPEVDYVVRLGPGVEAEAVDISFVAGGQEVSHPDRPLSGSLLWPGAVVEDDGVEWPGWELTEIGWVLDDADALEFPVQDVDLRFQIAPDLFTQVAAPDLETDECATDVEEVVLVRDPPEGPEPVRVLGVTLPRTGANVAILVAAGLGLAGLGAALVTYRRRASTRA